MANGIAARLLVMLNKGSTVRGENRRNFISLGAITKSESSIFSTLYTLQNDTNSNYDYLLELCEVGTTCQIVLKE